MNLKTNVRLRFSTAWEGVVVHRDSKKSTIQFPEGYEFRANILSQNDGDQTIDLDVLETVGRHAVVVGGDWIQNVPFQVVSINAEDVGRVWGDMQIAKSLIKKGPVFQRGEKTSRVAKEIAASN